MKDPNASAIEYQDVSVTLNLRGPTLASGVSPGAGSVLGYGDRMVGVPVSVSAMAALRQVFRLASDRNRVFDHVLRGRLGGGLTGYPFETSDKLELPKSIPTTP